MTINYTVDIKERDLRICASDNSVCKYYVEMNFKKQKYDIWIIH